MLLSDENDGKTAASKSRHLLGQINLLSVPLCGIMVSECRAALVLNEDQNPVPQPSWLALDQPWDDDDRKRRKKHKKKRKKRKKDSGGDDGAENDSDRRGKHKKRRKETDSAGADTEGDYVATDPNLSQS